jgi:hypothetical protein
MREARSEFRCLGITNGGPRKSGFWRGILRVLRWFVSQIKIPDHHKKIEKIVIFLRNSAPFVLNSKSWFVKGFGNVKKKLGVVWD